AWPQPGRSARRCAVVAVLRTRWPWSPELGTAKAQILGPDRRHAGVPARRPHVPRVVGPGAAPDDAGGRRRRRALFRVVGVVRTPGIRAPLPHIPEHVVQSPSVWSLLRNRMGLVAAIIPVPGDLLQLLAIPWRLRSRPAGVLPLRFGQEGEAKAMHPL